MLRFSKHRIESYAALYIYFHLFILFPLAKSKLKTMTTTKIKLRLILLFLFAILVSATGFILIRKTLSAHDKKQRVASQIAQLPNNLPFLALDKVSYPYSGQKTFIFHFHPDCEHCSYEAKAIQTNINAFAAAQLIWISEADAPTIRKFAKFNKLENLPNVHWMADTASVFRQVFGSSAVPAVLIYDENGKLLKNYSGETKPSALLKYLNNESETGL